MRELSGGEIRLTTPAALTADVGAIEYIKLRDALNEWAS